MPTLDLAQGNPLYYFAQSAQLALRLHGSSCLDNTVCLLFATKVLLAYILTSDTRKKERV